MVESSPSFPQAKRSWTCEYNIHEPIMTGLAVPVLLTHPTLYHALIMWSILYIEDFVTVRGVKGRVSRDGYFFECLNISISTFYVCADGFFEVFQKLSLPYTLKITCQRQLSVLFYPFLHRNKSFSIFLSPAGMSLTKLSLGGNNLYMTPLFHYSRPGKV